MERKVTVIPATIDAHTGKDIASKDKRRVAAYARVSTDSDEQFTSFQAQIDYYTKYIASNPLWVMVDVYADEGISGTNLKKRDSFNKMIQDALDGKIDLIVTKSISRFARNTVDSLTTIRKLKEHNVECYFEKENIYTFDSKGELLITIMSSLAQEESRSISENVTWGHRNNFANGKVKFAWNNLLGYRKGDDGNAEIDEEQAEVVRYIYNQYLYGLHTPKEIAEALTNKNVLTSSGKKTWTSTGILNILKNEKYKGDALLQKTYCESFLTHKMVKNKGEVPQYYVKNSHPAIIDEATWDLVQEEMKVRSSKGASSVKRNLFSMKLICAECGSHYGSQTWHAGTHREKKMFVCYGRKMGTVDCKSSSLSESYIQKAFLISFKEISKEKEEIMRNISEKIKLFQNDKILEAKISALAERISVDEKALADYQRKNGSRAYTDSFISGKMFQMYDDIQDLHKEFIQLNIKLKEKQEKQNKESAALGEYEKEQNFNSFDRTVFNLVIDKALVYKNKDIEFLFIGGMKHKFEFDAELYEYTKDNAKLNALSNSSA